MGGGVGARADVVFCCFFFVFCSFLGLVVFGCRSFFFYFRFSVSCLLVEVFVVLGVAGLWERSGSGVVSVYFFLGISGVEFV